MTGFVLSSSNLSQERGVKQKTSEYLKLTTEAETYFVIFHPNIKDFFANTDRELFTKQLCEESLA